MGTIFSSRLTALVNQLLDKEENNTGTINHKQWREFVEDLWADKLAHLREGGEEEDEQ